MNAEYREASSYCESELHLYCQVLQQENRFVSLTYGSITKLLPKRLLCAQQANESAFQLSPIALIRTITSLTLETTINHNKRTFSGKGFVSASADSAHNLAPMAR